jgi:hypothetical protein
MLDKSLNTMSNRLGASEGTYIGRQKIGIKNTFSY